MRGGGARSRRFGRHARSRRAPRIDASTLHASREPSRIDFAPDARIEAPNASGEGDVDATYPQWKKSDTPGPNGVMCRASETHLLRDDIGLLRRGLGGDRDAVESAREGSGRGHLGVVCGCCDARGARGKNGSGRRKGVSEGVSGHQASQVGERYLDLSKTARRMRFQSEKGPNLSRRAPNRIESRSFDWPNTGELGEFFFPKATCPNESKSSVWLHRLGRISFCRPEDGSVDEKAASPLFLGAPGWGLILGVTMNVSQRASLDPRDKKVEPQRGFFRAGADPANRRLRPRPRTVRRARASHDRRFLHRVDLLLAPPPARRPSVAAVARADWSAPIDPRFHRCRFLFEARRLSSPWARSRSS